MGNEPLFLDNGQVIGRWRSWTGQIVFAVVYSNYEPAEVDSIWGERSHAEARAEELDDGWYVQMWRVQ